MAESTQQNELAQLEKELEAQDFEQAPKGAALGKVKAAFQKKLSTFKFPAIRIGKILPGILKTSGEMRRALLSKDASTRRMAVVFFVSLGCAIWILGIGYQRYRTLQAMHGAQTQEDDGSKNLGEFIQKQSDSAKQKFSSITLGKFSVSFKPTEGARPARGVMYLAEMEIVLECDSKETRYYIEDHLAQAQDQANAVFTHLERDDLLTKDGKRKLKKRLLEKLNSWLPEGKVRDLFFSRLIVS